MIKLRAFLRGLAVAGLLGLWAVLTLAMLWPGLADRLDRQPDRRSPGPDGANYVVVVPERLSGSAQAWADYRRTVGYHVRLVTVTPPEATVEHVRAAIQSIYEESGRPYPFYVLLLGHAHVFAPDTYLPAASLPLDLPREYIEEVGFDFVASDDAYALDASGRSLWPIAIGRVPATSDEEALDVLARTREYEARPPVGSGRTQIELVASDSKFGQGFDQAIETLIVYFVETHMPDQFRWRLLYGHPGSPYYYPAEEFHQETARRLNAGALLVAYIGHGSGDSVGPALTPDGRRARVFAVEDVPLASSASSSIVMMLACSAGEYDQDWSLAERLLLQPGGPVATYAASRLTLPAANTTLGKDLFGGLLAGQAPTAGEWIRLAESNYRNPGSDRALSLWLLSRAIPVVYGASIRGNGNETPPLDADTIYGLQQHAYNLFGDPALALARPAADLPVEPGPLWEPLGGQVTFTGSAAPPGQAVTVTLSAPQGALLPQVAQAGDVRDRYEHANDKTVAQVVAIAGQGGEYSGQLHLPENLPGGRYILEAMTVSGRTTRTGTSAVYLGWSPVGTLLSAPGFWWLAVGALGAAWFASSKRHRVH